MKKNFDSNSDISCLAVKVFVIIFILFLLASIINYIFNDFEITITIKDKYIYIYIYIYILHFF